MDGVVSLCIPPGAGEQAAPVWRAALYTRLSREDGDKPESDSISNQRALLEDFLSRAAGPVSSRMVCR